MIRRILPEIAPNPAENLPSPPAGGGNGWGPEGEVGRAAVRSVGSPHLTPTLSGPEGGEGALLPR